MFHAKLPLLPEECEIIIMRRTGVEVGSDDAIYQDFRVRRHAIQQWLEYLVQHHPTFQSRQVEVDYARLDQLPVNGLVHDRLRTMENEQMDDAFLNTGPPEASLCDPWGLFFIHLMYESEISYLKGMNSGWMKLG